MISLLRLGGLKPPMAGLLPLDGFMSQVYRSAYACAYRERTSRGRAITRLGVVLMELIKQLLPEVFRTARVFVGVLRVYLSHAYRFCTKPQ